MSSLRSRVRRPSPALIVSLLALVIATSGVAFAANPFGSDGVIHACYDPDQWAANDASDVVIVKSAEVCARPGADYTEHFTFNARGPQGVPGAQGPAGAHGAQGPTGLPAPTPPKLSPAEAAKLAKKANETEKQVDKGADKLAALLEKLNARKPPKPKQMGQLGDAINTVVASLLATQQQQQVAIGALSPGLAFAAAQEKLKEAQKAAEKAEKEQQQIARSDTQRQLEQNLEDMIEQIIRFMREMQDAQVEQMRALTKG